MPVFRLPPKPEVAAAVGRGESAAVSVRLTDLAQRRGYALGPGGVAVHADGAVSIDCDRDPSAEWAAFDPATRTAAEQAEADERAQAVALLAALRAGTATSRQVQGALAWLLRRAAEGAA